MLCLFLILKCTLHKELSQYMFVHLVFTHNSLVKVYKGVSVSSFYSQEMEEI
jgi:hypothetical protein